MPVVSRRCNGKACGAQMPQRTFLVMVDEEPVQVQMCLCPRCDALKCDNPECDAYFNPTRTANKCPQCRSTWGIHTKEK